MKLNIFMQSNNVKHREKSTSAVLFDVRTLILTLVITMTMVMGTALFASSIAYAQSGSGATVRVATFDQLNDALGNGGVSDIIIDPQAAEEFADDEEAEVSFDGSDVFYIPIEYPLVVSHDVTISSEVAVNFARSGNGGSGKYDSKAFRGQNEITPALFNVDQGKTLTLNADIAMTGEEVSATFDPAQASFNFTVKARDSLDDEDDEDDNDAWSYGSDPGNLAKGGYFIYTKGGNVVMNDGVLLMGLNTLDNVKDIAPVYIDGTAKAATLTVEGAEIVDNNLGQTEDGNSTAGAVILKGENATAALNSGAISNNNADVAGIIVKEEAGLELGNDFGIDDSDIYDEKAEEAAEEEAAQEEAAEEETEEATEETAEETKEDTKEEAAEETKEETKDEAAEETPIVVAPKKSLKSSKSSATQMRSGNGVSNGTVKTFSELKTALTNKISPIVLDSSLTKKVDGVDKYYFPIDEPLTVNYPVEITTVTKPNTDPAEKKEIIIARSNKFKEKVSESNPAIFNVTAGGHLTLSDKVTMTGDEIEKPKTVKLKLTSGNKYFGFPSEGLQKLVPVDDPTKALELSVDSNGFLKYVDTQNNTHRFNFNLQPIKDSTTSTDIKVKALNNQNQPEADCATSLEEGRTYVAYYTSINYGDKYLVNGSDGKSFTTDSNFSAAIRFTAEPVSGASGSSTELKVNAKTGDDVWTAEEVLPGGYFIHATGGGIVDIQEGVTLQGLNTKTAFTNGGRETKNGVEYWTYTDDTVTNAAPVYIGGGSTLNMSGGTIQNNRVGYGADENDSSSSIQWLKRRLSEEAFPTNTAGGIIATGDGTTVNITSKAKISNNQADAGALIIKDNALVTMDKVGANKPEISSNIGWHHSGGALVESGATLHLIDGKINDNIAWGKGGAVWATEWGTNGWPVWDNYPNTIKNTAARQSGGNFIMDGGELSGNFAFARGGAIEVESNGVTLNGGDITGNRCKSLGGAMYIEGDSPIYTYTVVIQKGFISENTAVSGANSDLDKRIDGNKLANTDPNKKYNPYHYDKDFAGWRADGDGGGVWLCSMGGTSVFTSDENNANQQVVIDNNTSDRLGDDFFVSAKKGAALIQNLLGVWYYDTGNAENPLGDRVEPEGQEIDPATGKVIHGRKGLVNGTNPNYTSGLGIQITGNKARDGGGIACNGTIVLGEPQNVYRYETELELTKTWETGLTPEEVTLQLYYEYPKDSGNWHQLTAADVKYEVELGGNLPNLNGDEQSGPASDPAATNVIYQTEQWKARASIPSFTQHTKADGTVEEVPLYRIKKPGNANGYFDLVNSKADIEALYKYYEDHPNAELEVEWNIQVREKNNKFDPRPVGDTTATSDPNKTKKVSTVTVKDSANESVRSFSVYYTSVTLNQTIKNYPNGRDIELDKVGFNNAQINGAQFKLYKVTKTNGNDWDYVVNTDSVQSATSNKGKLNFEGLQAGKYFLFEETPAAGYRKPNDPWLIEVTNNDVKVYTQTGTTGRNGTGEPAAGKHWDKVNKLSSTVAPETYTAGYFTNKVWPDWFFSDTPVTENKLVNEVPSIKIKKTKNDGTTGLGGARFAFGDVSYEDNNTKYYAGVNSLIKNGNELVVVTSNANTGEIDLAPVIQALDPTASPNHEGQGRHINSDEINLLMYELSSGALHKQKTTPWLVTITNKGVVKITEHTNPYSFNISPVNESTKKLRQELRDNVSNFSNVVSTGTIEGGAFVKNEPKTYEIEKIGPNNEPVNGAKFNLYKVDDTTTNVGNDDLPHGKFKISSTTPVNGDTPLVSANGKITLPITERGAYLLFETEAPNGYVRSQLPWGIYVNSKDELSGWTINENSVTTVLPLVTNTDGSIKTPVTDIEITCEQMNVPAGKIKNDKFNVELTKKNLDGEPVDGAIFELYEVKNIPNGKTVENLIDADWTSTFNANDWDMAKVNGNRVGADTEIKSKDGGKISLPITKKGVYFLFETTVASSDYVKPVDPWVIVVSDYGKVVVRKSDGNAQNGTQNGISWWRAYKYTKLTGTEIINTKQIKINKVKGEFNSEGNLVLETATSVNNAKFKLYNASESGTNITRGTAVSNTEISSTNGIIGLPQSLSLQGGKKLYWLEETSAAPGYVKADKPWVLWVQDGKLQVIYRYKVYDGSGKVDNNPTNYVEAYRHDSGTAPYIHNEQYILKVDKNTVNSDTPYVLANAKFKLYHAMVQTKSGTSGTVRRGNDNRLVCELTSDSQGRIYLPTSITKQATTRITDPNYSEPKWDGVIWDEGYMLVEEKAPGGYEKAKAPWWITVDANGNITVKTTSANPQGTSSYQSLPNWYVSDFAEITKNSDGEYLVTNTPGDVGLTKKDGNTKAPLRGAVFKVYKADFASGSYNYKVGDFVDYTTPSDQNGFFALPETGPDPANGGEKENMYFLFEYTAPNGYALSEKPWLVVVKKSSQWVSYSQGYKVFTSIDVFPHTGTTTGENPGTVYHVECGEYNDTIYNYPSVNLVKADADTVIIGNNVGDLTTDAQTKLLEGVEFRLYKASKNDSTGIWTWSENSPVETVKIDANGKTVKDAVIKSNANGTVELGTLSANSYYVLKEVTPIEGYILPSEEWRIVTDSEGKLKKLRVWDGTRYIDGRLAGADGTPACNIITNTKIYDLPSTGGMGTYWFMVIGAMMMGFALTAAITKMDILKMFRR